MTYSFTVDYGDYSVFLVATMFNVILLWLFKWKQYPIVSSPYVYTFSGKFKAFNVDNLCVTYCSILANPHLPPT